MKGCGIAYIGAKMNAPQSRLVNDEIALFPPVIIKVSMVGITTNVYAHLDYSSKLSSVQVMST